MGKTVNELIEFILENHHKFMRRILPELDAGFRQVLSQPETKTAKGGASEIFESIQGPYRSLSAEIQHHLFKEEQILFPSIEGIAKGEKGGMCGHIGGPINQMIFEHENAKKELDEIKAGVEKARGNGNAGKLSKEAEKLAENLLLMRSDLIAHIKIEEEELFPAAIEMCN